jgi:hypothetical protein
MTKRSGKVERATSALDAEQASAVVSMPPGLTAKAVAVRLKRKFGDRAWSERRVREFRIQRLPHVRRGKIEGDAAMKAFVDARIGSMTLDQIVSRLRKLRGESAPARSSVQRYVERERRRLDICNRLRQRG